MALPTITPEQIKDKGVQSLPNKLTGTAEQNKQKFDQLVADVVGPQFNALVEMLEASGGAQEIGATVNGIEATKIQGVLNALKSLIDSNRTTQGATNSGLQEEIENRYTKNQTDNLLKQKLDAATGEELVKAIEFNSDTGVFTITTLGGNKTTIDTLIEKLPVSFSIVGNKLRVTADDGTYQEADLSAFVDTYTFKSGDTITFSQTGKEVSAAVKAGSIGKTHFQPDVMEEIESYAERAEEAAEAAAIDQVGASVILDAVLLHKTSIEENAAAAANSAVYAKTYQDNASTYAKSAQGASNDARNYSLDAEADKNAAAKSAEEAAKSKSAAAGSASNAQIFAENAQRDAVEAKRYAVGGTGTDALEDEDNAMYYATKAKRYAVGGTETGADEERTNAKYYSERAGMWAMGPSSEYNNPDNTHNASYYCAMAQSAQNSAKGYAEAAAESASQCADAVEKAAEAEESAQKARVWAVGYEHDYTAPGDNNNAKYWAGVAKENANAKQGNWAQGDENKPDYIFNRTHYTDVISEGGTILEEKSLTYGSYGNFMMLSGIGTNQVRVGGKYRVIWNGSAYTRVAYEYKNEVTIGNASLIGDGGENTYEPFCLTDMDTTNCACYKEKAGAGTITIKVEGVREEMVKQLDPKYIKDMYYTEYGEELLVPTEATYVGGSQFKLTDRLGLVAGKEYLVTVNGVEYAATAKSYKADFLAGVSLGNAALGGESGKEDTGEPFLLVDLNESSADSFGYGVAIWFGDGSVGVTVGVSTAGVVHQIPAKYIPGGAGGGSGADLLNENGIIKQEVLPDGFPYASGGYILPETAYSADPDMGMAILPDIVDIKIGLTFRVIWNGVAYETVAIENNFQGMSIPALGNGAMVGGDDTGEPFAIMAFPDSMEELGGGAMIVAPLDGSLEGTFSIFGETVDLIGQKYLPKNVKNNVAIYELYRDDDGAYHISAPFDELFSKCGERNDIVLVEGYGSHRDYYRIMACAENRIDFYKLYNVSTDNSNGPRMSIREVFIYPDDSVSAKAVVISVLEVQDI